MSLKTDEQTQVRWQQLTETYLKSQFDIKNKEKFSCFGSSHAYCVGMCTCDSLPLCVIV